ncbi:hypothetical protein BH11PLA2_BH11PLA2_12450 [soil metagenome]
MPPTEPRLSIVIPSHRRCDLLEACLQSVTHFAPTDAEIIVVDDGSRRGIISRTATAFPGVTVIRHNSPRGFCCAANTGIGAATGTIVELLNDDAEVTEAWADAALKAFRDSHVVAVAPLVLIHGKNPPRIDSAGDHYDRGGFACKRHHGQVLSSVRLVPGNIESVSASAGFYRRTALISAGMFSEEFGAYFDDVDLSQRLLKQGTIRFEPASVVFHHVSSSYGTQPGRRLIEQQSRNEEWLFWRHARPAHLPRHATVLAGKALRRMEEGTLGPWLTGRLKAVLTAFQSSSPR